MVEVLYIKSYKWPMDKIHYHYLKYIFFLDNNFHILILLVEEYNYGKSIAKTTMVYFNKVLYIMFLSHIYTHLYN